MSQRRMGPAPFASFEDLSDEARTATEETTTVTVRLPDIHECPGGGTTSTLQTPSTPRIDISRASSSSHHEEDNSRDSTPERELFEPACTRLGLAFKEDGAMDLRSSTEELDFQEAGDASVSRSRSPSHQQQQYHHHHHHQQQARKDSGGSELGLLSVSGRTSRISSIGSQGSRVSGQSHLSGVSRSPSPHKMLLETSFCGTKAAAGVGTQIAGGASVALEQALLSRKQDPTEAVLAEGISIESRKKIQMSPKIIVRPQLHHPPPTVTIEDSDKPPMSPGKTIVAESGVEYTFIPLKGPLPLPNRKPGIAAKTKAGGKKGTVTMQNNSCMDGGPEYIRIKLKPDYLYDDTDLGGRQTDISSPRTPLEVRKPVTLNLNNGTGACSHHHPQPRTKVTAASGGSPKLPRLRETAVLSRTPSPSVSRKSSFTSLFRSKEAVMSPESPGGENRARSKSKEREHKSSVFGIFKPKKSTGCNQKKAVGDGQRVPVTSPLPSLEFTFSGGARGETALEGDSIRIPLHSPTHEAERERERASERERALAELSSPPPAAVPVSSPPPPPPPNPRHSSTSSENIVFTTNLGSNNEIFTTKLPKERLPKEDVSRVTDNHVVRQRTRSCSEKTDVGCEPPPSLDGRTASSESENESERTEPLQTGRHHKEDGIEGDDDEHEMKTLVFQQDSFEDEDLPYIPTTLPLERSVAIPIVPVKQRGEIKMCPIDRPRSTTPINPNCLDEYCEDVPVHGEPKMRISLPRDECHGKSKSPRKWADFAEMDMGRQSSSPPPPPLPPRGAPKDWINFEEVPERRKLPKRIQMIPSASRGATSTDDNVVYSYVNPEDCKCECHELAPRLVSEHVTSDAFPPNPRVPSSSS